MKRQSLVRRAIRISVVEGIYAQVHATIAWPGSVFLTKLVVLLRGGPRHFGLLSAIGQFSQVFQPLGAVVGAKVGSRKRVVLVTAGVGRALVLGYGILPLLVPQWSLGLVLALFFVSTSLQAVAGNAWIAWVSDIVPPEIRARFFARRNQVLLVAGLATGLLTGAVVDAVERGAGPLAPLGRALVAFLPVQEPSLWCMAAIFVAATGAGLVSLRILATQPEFTTASRPPHVWQALAVPWRDTNFRQLLLFGAWWMLAVGIGAPFWQPFMITKLHMSMVQIQIYGLISTTASILVLRPWGRLIDRVGNKVAMRVAIVLGGLNPFLWVFLTPRTSWVVYLEAVSSGVMWAGAGLVATNFVLSVSAPAHRQVCSGIYGAVTGLALMVTMLLSGFARPPHLTLGTWHPEPEQVLFALTGLLRWTTLVPLGWVREPLERKERALQALWELAKVKMDWLDELFPKPKR